MVVTVVGLLVVRSPWILRVTLTDCALVPLSGSTLANGAPLSGAMTSRATTDHGSTVPPVCQLVSQERYWSSPCRSPGSGKTTRHWTHLRTPFVWVKTRSENPEVTPCLLYTSDAAD